MSGNTVKVKNRPDYPLIIIVAILIIFGVLILSSVSFIISQERFGTSFYYLNHQVLYGLIPGLILAYFSYKINLNLLKKWIPIFLLINLFFLILVFVPKFGLTSGGASRWVSLGPLSFQPSEFLKIIFILYLASWLESRTKLVKLSQPEKGFSQTLIAFLIILFFISLILIYQPDASTLGIILITATLMFFLAGTPLWHTLLIGLIGLGVLILVVKIAPYRANRIAVLFNPEADPMGIGYHLKNALIAVGSGGISGLGLGLSMQKFKFLPQSISDSIFAIFAEETGFIGSFILLLLCLIFFWRGFKIGKRSKDQFSRLTAFGITIWITLQTFFNIGSMIGILPLSGIPLPFISYGGSALISELIGVGILLNISKQS